MRCLRASWPDAPPSPIRLIRPFAPNDERVYDVEMVMIPEELERFAWRVGALRSTVMHMANPVDHPDRWRQEWAELKELVAEIDRLHAALPPGT
jgi:hypothetical protein